ncbi:MAG: glycosyltransferase family 39 protein, partial [Pseudomonadota bacterium]
MSPFSGKKIILPLLGLLILACTLLAGFWTSRTHILIPDELSMVAPGIERIFHQEPTPSKYPPAAPAFFELWLRAADHLLDLASRGPEFAFLVARVGNLLLYSVNLLLFFLVARPYLGGRAAILAVGLFALNPVVFYSAVHVKTEGLLLASICLCFLASGRISREPERVSWHALAGASCALAAATKYNGVLPVAYLAAVLVSSSNKSGTRPPGQGKALLRGALVFLVSFLGCLVVLWPDFLHGGEQLGQWAKDLYFLPGPSWFTAMEGTWVFPYGRFSYPLLFTIPFFMGPLVYLSALAGLFTRSLPRDAAWIWGLFSALYLLVAFLVTRLQYPPAYLPVAPFLTLLAVSFWKKLARSPKKIPKATGWFLAGAAILLALVQYPTMRNISNSVVDATHKARQYVEQHGEDNAGLILLMNSSLSLSQGLTPLRLEEGVLNRKPDYILVLDSYLRNFSKQLNPDYQRQAGLWDKLIQGEAGYEVLWTYPVRYPLQW